MGHDEFGRKRRLADQSFLSQGITFTVYSDSQGTEKIFPFDLIPAHHPGGRMGTSGTRPDPAHPRAEPVSARRLPRAAHPQGESHPRGIRAQRGAFPQGVHGFNVPRDIYIHVCGTDLIRDRDGNYLVLEDNGRTPSGVSYVLENRQAMKRVSPGCSDGIACGRWTTTRRICSTCCATSRPESKRDPTVALLTPGIYNSAYYEHSYLARSMGIEIVEGRDLVAQGDGVFMKTTKGLKPVDVIYRRIDDDFLDPQVFRPDSLLGVPGIVNAYRHGKVSLANSIGTGVADDKVMYYFVPRMIKFYLGEDPILPNVETYLSSEETDRKFILENLDKLVVKSANESGGYGC